MKEQLYSDKELEKLKKNEKFKRDEKLKDFIHKVYQHALWFFLLILIGLFILDILRPSWLKNVELVDKSVFVLGTAILTHILTKFKNLE